MKTKYARTYINPRVTRIDSNYPDIGFYIWMRSRKWIITDKDGDRFMVTMPLTEYWVNEVPDEFYVGSELVSKIDYMARIDAMNLQYNNSEAYVFEIDGSCLFRDFLFNVNKIAQWAQSNRFLFSILDEEERNDSRNYHISSEYAEIPEWEDQFDTYMDAIRKDPIVDHNRLEMPYSISSTFWICVNKKTLKDLVNFMYNEMPFFYEFYGSRFGITPDKNYSRPESLSQYIIKGSPLDEGITRVADTVIVASDMSLILYSQFIRQSDTLTSGFYNLLLHDNARKFSHLVFKGSTTFRIHYVADIDKVHRTVSNRLCAFAMSSGNDPSSWSYFINNFIPKDFKAEELEKWLPCKFDEHHQLINCKFHDDVKFRNEGKEISNCPCPLVTMSLEHAKMKRDRDQNRIGDAYYRLTELMLNNKQKE